MEKITYHPLRSREDALKRALLLSGFELVDDHAACEVEPADWAVRLFARPDGAWRSPVMLADGFALRCEPLAAQLSRLRGHLPVKAFSVGRVYDARDVAHPGREVIQCVWGAKTLTMNECIRWGEVVAQEVFGIGARVRVEDAANGTATVYVEVDGAELPFAIAGKASPLARALLGVANEDAAVWFFEIDVDDLVMGACGFATRDDLYSPIARDLARYVGDCPAMGSTYVGRASNTLRLMGFDEFFGRDIYEADCYLKMNMIQDSWDKNNSGIQLVEPLGASTGLPTVRVPALEEALARNWQAGERDCRIFELRHIFLPGEAGRGPVEKVALSFGGYGPDLDDGTWKTTVDEFLTRFGIQNHFFIPLPAGKAPAYHPHFGCVVMDERMTYLEGNFGAISPAALENHGIGVQAYMAQFEFEPIERKAAQEFDFVLPDYQ